MHGEYDSNTSICTEYLGIIVESDRQAFSISNGDSENFTMFYQYDTLTNSGILIIGGHEDDHHIDILPHDHCDEGTPEIHMIIVVVTLILMRSLLKKL